MEITVEYFAILKDQAGCEVENLSGVTAATPAALYESLRARHGFSLSREHLRVAVNDEFARWDDPLQSGSRVVFIPPVAGG